MTIFGSSPDLNLIVISVDTLRPDHLGCYGYTDVRTPNIDGLAAGGARFTDATSAVPLTLPSHATILTGLYPPSHGIRDNAYMALPQKIETLAETLHRKGYSTLAVVGAFVLDSRYGLDQGFDIYDDDLKGGRQPREFNYVEIQADEVTRKTIAHLRQTAEPFFAFVHYYDPHATYDPPEPFLSMYAERPYDGEIAYTDQAIGRVLDYLRDEKLLERTLIVLVSDHGEGLGEHGEPTHGVLVYQATLHVPFIVRIPLASGLEKKLPPGSTVEMPVSLADVYASVLDILGVRGGPATEGRSVLSRIGEGRDEDETFYFESLYPYLAYRWSPLRGLRRGNWKYILAPREELYNLADDPRETANLVAGEPAVAKDLKDRLTAVAGAMEAESPQAAAGPDQEEIRKLRSLGYLSGGKGEVPGVLDTRGADPKAVIDRFAPLMGDGEDALAAGDLDKALLSFSRLTEMDPGNPQVRVFKARVLQAMGRTGEAVDEYILVTEIDPANSTPYFELGNIAQAGGRLDEAMAYFKKALDLTPGSPEALANMGSIMMEKNMPDSAEALLMRALRTDPLNRVALLNMALLYDSRGASDEALTLFRRTLGVDPGSVKAMANIAAIYAAKGLVDSTITYLEAARKLEPANPTILANLGNAYRQNNEPDKAEASYQAALDRDPGNTLALFGLAAVRAGQGRKAEAEALLKRLLALHPDFKPARTALENLSRR